MLSEAFVWAAPAAWRREHAYERRGRSKRPRMGDKALCGATFQPGRAPVYDGVRPHGSRCGACHAAIQRRIGGVVA